MCGSFQSQVETMEDVQILRRAANETTIEAAKAGHTVTVVAIVEAMSKMDFKTLESVVVEYRCAHSK